MSWSQTPPPLSPHKVKSKKQHILSDISTSQCGKNYDNSPTTSIGSAKKCPSTITATATRKVNYKKYCLPTVPHQMSDPSSSRNNNIKSPKSPSNHHFEFELSSPTHFSLRSSPHNKNNMRCYYERTTDSAPATLSSPMKKYDYNFVVSDSSAGGLKKFECSNDSNVIDTDLNTAVGGAGDLYSMTINKKSDCGEASTSNSKKPLLSPFMENEVYFATCNPRKNKIMTKRHYNVSPDGVSSLDDYSTTTLLYETTIPGRRMSITISDGGNSSEISSEPLLIAHESMETSSLITQSTNFSNTTTTNSSPTSPGLSMATTASCNTIESMQTQTHLRPKSLSTKITAGGGIAADNNDDMMNSQENISLNLHQRRHAINITNNPGYKVLHHTSHSILAECKRNVDRTCSDSATEILKHRKSTSDLTDDEQFRKDYEKVSSSSSASKHRRRGSSKGGLAYLVEKRDSRRGSRESVMSQQSNFSNEDIGPLTNFQQTPRGRQRRTSNFLELPVPDHIRPRVCSLPDRPYNPRVSEDLYRLRTFSISKGTVVNCGDSIISRRSRSNTSVNSTTSKLSERSPFDGSCCGGYTGNNDDSSSEEPTPPPRYRVVMLGESGTGKTALVNQFMTSEYMHTYDASLDDEFGEKTVSVLLDGEESELIFIDHPAIEMSVENSLSTYEPHACVIVYSIVQKSSFRVAEEILNYLWRENVTDKAVIIVGNKADLARSRVISTSDGKQLAASRDVKFIETSSGIQHNVDELLVGILKQIRLKETREKKQSASKMKNSRTHTSLHVAKEILQKICFNQLDITKSKSCENLHVL